MEISNCPESIITDGVFCGIDASLTSSGFCKIVGNKIHSDTIKTKPDSFPTDLERYLHISDTITENIPSDVSMVCIEDFYTPRNSAQFGSAMSLISLGTIIRVSLLKRGIPFFVVAPLTLKKYATGKGCGPKDVIMLHLFKRYGMEFKDNNQADAFALSLIAGSVYGKLKGKNGNMTKPQQESVNKIIHDSKRYNIP